MPSGRKPSRARLFGSETGSSFSQASPAVAITRPVRILIVVVLPAPLGPMKPKISPDFTSRSTAFTASTGRIQKPVRKVL